MVVLKPLFTKRSDELLRSKLPLSQGRTHVNFKFVGLKRVLKAVDSNNVR